MVSFGEGFAEMNGCLPPGGRLMWTSATRMLRFGGSADRTNVGDFQSFWCDLGLRRRRCNARCTISPENRADQSYSV